MDRGIIGRFGEDVACEYLANSGNKIIDRNFKTKFGEIDVVSISSDKTLLFVEVKTIDARKMSQKINEKSYPHLSGNAGNLMAKNYTVAGDYIKPEDEMSYSKRAKFQKIAEWYANKHGGLSLENGYQLDMIAVEIKDNSIDLRHYKNIHD